MRIQLYFLIFVLQYFQEAQSSVRRMFIVHCYGSYSRHMTQYSRLFLTAESAEKAQRTQKSAVVDKKFHKSGIVY
jgi:hypothetical protein